MKLLFVLSEYGDPTSPWFTVVLDGRGISNPQWEKERRAVLGSIESLRGKNRSDRSGLDNHQDWSTNVLEELKKMDLKSIIIDPYPNSKKGAELFEEVERVFSQMVVIV
jgi:hypothetical protein